MLILAGVSLNATIGDNGIITRAQQTNIAQGRAVLEEYLNQYYVEHYEELKDSENKAVSLITFPETSGYFYKPDLGALNYVVDSEGHALYLINKSGLPKEIKDGLVGGDAGNGEYADYQSLNDVYGVTSNLKVYYCSNGLDSITGLAKEELDIDNPTRVVFPAGSALAELITGSSDKEITAQDVKQITELEVDGKKVSNLSDLYNLTSLKTLILKDYNGSMEGVENATQINKIQLENCVISDYSSIGKLGKKLNKLYLYNVDDSEITKLCDKKIGIADYELENLNYFGIVGNKTSLDYETTSSVSATKSSKKIKNTANLDNLKTKTKEAVKYLYVNNNEIADLSGFKNYKSVLTLRGEYNSLTTLSGLENMQELTYLIVRNNELGVDETEVKNEKNDALTHLVGKNKLRYLDLQVNKIIHISYIGKLNNLIYLLLLENSKFALAEIPDIAQIYNKLLGSNKNIDGGYLDYLTTSETLIYKNLASQDIDKINYLKNLPQEQKNNVKFINLSGSTIENSIFNEILSGYNNLVELNCTSCSKLETLDWIKGKTKLKQFLFENTAIVGNEVSKLDTYATALESFKCNNSAINLTSMQLTISRTKCYNSQYSAIGYCGAGITGNLSNKLEECTDITYICTNGLNGASDGLLDLTNTSLTSGYFQGGGKIKLPSSVNKIDYFHVGPCFLDFSNLQGKYIGNLSLLGFSSVDTESQKWQLENLSNSGISIEMLLIHMYQNGYLDYDVLSYLDSINMVGLNFNGFSAQENFKFVPESWNGTLLNLKSITMTGTTLNNLDFLQDNMLLESVSLINCKIADISGLKCYNTLKNLVLSSNNITNLDGISNFTHLGENVNGTAGILNLSSNPIYDTYNYPSVDGVSKKVQNIEELVKLKQSARSLNTIILLPNEYIIDYGPLEKLGYNKNTGKF